MSVDQYGFKQDHYVSAYAVTRHYGGPEEGGWWYNWYHHLKSTKRIRPRKIGNWARRLENEFSHLNEGNIYSVLGGTEVAIMTERWPGQFASRERPHYE